MKFAIGFRLLTMLLTAIAVLAMLAESYEVRRRLRGWWANRVQIWRLRADWKRRVRARHAAQCALSYENDWSRRHRREQVWSLIVGALAGLAFAALLLLHGCGGDPLPLPDGMTDAGAPSSSADAGVASPDAGGAADAGAPVDHQPVCMEIQQGVQFFASDFGDAAPALVLNQSCTRVCRNSAGGQTCIALWGVLVHCAQCGEGSP